jgi:glutamine amidotransferase
VTIGIIDIGIGNLGSLRHAVHSQGWDTVSASQPDHMAGLSHLLLPGVGAFASAMARLESAGLVEPIRRFAEAGRPVLGICLGMQLLAEAGMEGGDIKGLGLIPGRAMPIVPPPGIRLPHVGWNEAHQIGKHPVLKGIRDDVDFYFVHSYRFAPTCPGDVLAETEHGERFASMVARGNVVGVQFHPEKSQTNGLRLLDNFCLWDGTC